VEVFGQKHLEHSRLLRVGASRPPIQLFCPIFVELEVECFIRALEFVGFPPGLSVENHFYWLFEPEVAIILGIICVNVEFAPGCDRPFATKNRGCCLEVVRCILIGRTPSKNQKLFRELEWHESFDCHPDRILVDLQLPIMIVFNGCVLTENESRKLRDKESERDHDQFGGEREGDGRSIGSIHEVFSWNHSA
jgi:hypothetical protein